jgi:hypothetical protein
VAATVTCWLAAAILLWTARSPRDFEHVLGKTIKAQYRLMPRRSAAGTDYRTFLDSMRRLMLGLGGLVLLLAIISSFALIRG